MRSMTGGSVFYYEDSSVDLDNVRDTNLLEVFSNDDSECFKRTELRSSRQLKESGA